jgi:hypothetical protein
VKPLPAGKPLGHGVTEKVRLDAVIVPPVPGAADPFHDASLLQESGVGAHAALAHPELAGQLIQ